MPTFLVIGAQKGGTTSLYHYLTRHPAIHKALTKEVHYFDLNFSKGVDWYRRHFPLSYRPSNWSPAHSTLTGEATPYYLFHPLVAQRVRQVLPAVRLIVLLRNPADRALSHYNHERALGFEWLSFEQAIQQEAVRLEGEEARIAANEGYNSFAHMHFSYLARGEYPRQLSNWLTYFPRRQVLVLCSERLFDSPGATLRRACEFLEVPWRNLTRYPVRNARSHLDMAPRLRKQLSDHFLSSNRQVYDLVGEDFGWESGL